MQCKLQNGEKPCDAKMPLHSPISTDKGGNYSNPVLLKYFHHL